MRTTLRMIGITLAVLAGCDTDDFVVAGESDSCSSSGAGERALEACVGEDCDEAVMDPPLAERHPGNPDPSRPARASVQERR